MANARFGNTFYIDTQYSGSSDELAVKNMKVKGIFLNSVSTSCQLLLTDSGNNKVNLRGNNLGGSIYFNLVDTPIIFNNSIRPSTLTNATATLILEDTQG